MTWQLLLAIGLAAASPTKSVPDTPSQAPFDLLATERRADGGFRIGAFKTAAEHYGQLVARNPTDGLYWYRWGESLRRIGQFEQAIEPLLKAEELGGFHRDPPRWVHRGEAAFSLAAAHAALGHREQALDWTRKSLARGVRDIRKFHADAFAELLEDAQFRQVVWAVDVDGLSRDEGYRLDLKFFIHELKRVHYAPFRATPEAEIDRMAAALDAEIPELSDDAVFVRMMAIIRQFGDGHTRMQREQQTLPVVFFQFPEGLHVVAAAPPHTDLVGARVVKIAGQPVDEALSVAETLVARENPMMPSWLAPAVLRWATVLRGLGWAAPEGPIDVEIEDAPGETRSVSLQVPAKRIPWESYSRRVPGCSEPVPLCLRRANEHMWWERLPDGKTVYCQINGIGHGKATFQTLCEKLFAEVEAGDPQVERLVLDLRWNGGGNTFLNPPLVNGIIRSEKFRKPGALFVVMGRNTFSAAINTLIDLEQRTTAILVGEPICSPPNFVGESVEVVLPYSGWPISISDLAWQTSFPMDYRVWVSPRLYAPPTAAAFRAHDDPAINAILEFLGQPSQASTARH